MKKILRYRMDNFTPIWTPYINFNSDIDTKTSSYSSRRLTSNSCFKTNHSCSRNKKCLSIIQIKHFEVSLLAGASNIKFARS